MTPHASAGHVVIVAYLFEPNEMIAVRRPRAIRNGLEAAGVRTTVVTSQISGTAPGDRQERIVRTVDLRTRFKTQYQALVGYREMPIVARAAPRWWTRFIVPDVPAVSWMPTAVAALARILMAGRPDAIITTSPPDSAHLVGLAAHSVGVRWIADFRDGWMFDTPNPRSALQRFDSSLERVVVRRADAVTAVNDQIANDFRRRLGVDAICLPNGYDRAELEQAPDERSLLDPGRFSLVYTGTLGIDMVEGGLGTRGEDARAFLDALERLLWQRPEFAGEIELVVAGVVTEAERAVLTRGALSAIVRVVGRLPHTRALGLQRAADALVLVSGGAGFTTGKVFEYLGARRPIFALADRPSAVADLLDKSDGHVVVPSWDAAALASELQAFIGRWRSSEYRPSSDIASEYTTERMAERMLEIVFHREKTTAQALR
jgi:Glycosyl transferase 4-like domain/Glycosyl transferases group 1